MPLYSAIVDPLDVFPIQAERLVKSIVEVDGINAEKIVLHLVRKTLMSIYRSLNSLWVEILKIKRF